MLSHLSWLSAPGELFHCIAIGLTSGPLVQRLPLRLRLEVSRSAGRPGRPRLGISLDVVQMVDPVMMPMRISWRKATRILPGKHGPDANRSLQYGFDL